MVFVVRLIPVKICTLDSCYNDRAIILNVTIPFVLIKLDRPQLSVLDFTIILILTIILLLMNHVVITRMHWN